MRYQRGWSYRDLGVGGPQAHCLGSHHRRSPHLFGLGLDRDGSGAITDCQGAHWRPQRRCHLPGACCPVTHADIPLVFTAPGTDWLECGPAVEALRRLLDSPALATPLVIGVYGGWGTGKSSVMQTLEAALTASERLILWFDAWSTHARSRGYGVCLRCRGSPGSPADCRGSSRPYPGII